MGSGACAESPESTESPESRSRFLMINRAPSNSEQYKRKLRSIISENPDYWLASENSTILFWEYIDRFEIRLGYLKEALCRTRIPTMDTVLRRAREIKEELKKEVERETELRNLPPEKREEKS